jgi:hypothetical protein
MKYQVILLNFGLKLIFFCVFLSNCANSSNKPNTTLVKTDSIPTPINTVAQSVADDVVPMSALDSVQAIYDKQIPASNYREVFKGSYYKHYMGRFNDEPAELNLTLSQAGYDGDYVFSGSMIIGKERRLIQLFGNQSFMKERDSTRISFDIEEESDSIKYPTGFMKGHFSNNAASFKGIMIDEHTLKPIYFNFQESYTEGVSKFELSPFGKTTKYKGVNTRYLLWRFKNTESDSTPFYLLEGRKDDNGAKSSINQFEDDCDRSKKVFLKFRDENIKMALEDTINGHFETGIGFNWSTCILSNNRKLMVVQFNNWQTDASSYGAYWTECVMYDLEKNIRLQEKDVLKANYKKTIKAVAKKHYPWMLEIRSGNYIENTLQFSAVTKEGILMLGEGNHGWMCSYFFFPISEVKEALKSSFVSEYLDK